jgi:hypothetical protein
MKESSVKWLNCTVFYHQTEWHRLLGQCLLPVLNKLKEKQWINGFHIYFNTERGDSVQLAVIAYAQHSIHTLELIHATITYFLKEQPAAPGNESYLNQRFFKDFPTNEIRYHLFTIETKDTTSMAAEDLDVIHQAISEAILHALCADEVNNESLFAITTYLLLAVVKGDDSNLKAAGEAISRFLTTGAKDGIAGEQETPENVVNHGNWTFLYEENQETFCEILNEVWKETTRSEALYWLKGWEIKWQTIADKYTLEQALPVLLPELFKHLGLHYSAQVGHAMGEILYKIIQAVERKSAVSASVIKSHPGITAILTVWKRDHLEEQINALLRQTLPPVKIWIYHCHDYIVPDDILVKKYPQIEYQHNTGDLGYFGRFSLGLHATSPFLFIMDDDVIPSSNWLEKCHQLCSAENAIIATAGRRLRVNDLMPERPEDRASCFFGDNDDGYSWNICKSDTIVDFGCNSWFIKTEWLHHFWSIKPHTFETGEDIHLSVSCLLRAGIKTICPAQNLQEACGNLKKGYGFDQYASWKDGQFITKREKIFKYWINEYGWQPVYWQKQLVGIRPYKL